MNIAIVFAGGSGVRMGAGVPKQFLEINGKPILVHTLSLFEEHHEIDKIYLAVLEEYIEYVWALATAVSYTHLCCFCTMKLWKNWSKKLKAVENTCKTGILV